MKSFKIIFATAVSTLIGSQAQASYGVYAISSNGVFSLATKAGSLNEAINSAIAGCQRNNGWKCRAPSVSGSYLYAFSGMYMSVARSDTSNRGTQIMTVGYSYDGQDARNVAWEKCKERARGHFHWVSKGRTRTEPLASTCRVIYHVKN